jgi:imidazolonepropionase-like amidohydrolase
VLPGLIDRHVHLMQDQQPNDGRAAFLGLHYALKDLNAGFTTLQDMGSASTYATVELRDAINKGLVPGPRLQGAGPQLNPRGASYTQRLPCPISSVSAPVLVSGAHGRRKLALARACRRPRTHSLWRRLDQNLRHGGLRRRRLP